LHCLVAVAVGAFFCLGLYRVCEVRCVCDELFVFVDGGLDAAGCDLAVVVYQQQPVLSRRQVVSFLFAGLDKSVHVAVEARHRIRDVAGGAVELAAMDGVRADLLFLRRMTAFVGAGGFYGAFVSHRMIGCAVAVYVVGFVAVGADHAGSDVDVERALLFAECDCGLCACVALEAGVLPASFLGGVSTFAVFLFGVADVAGFCVAGFAGQLIVSDAGELHHAVGFFVPVAHTFAGVMETV